MTKVTPSEKIAIDSIDLVRRWLTEAEKFPAGVSATRLAGVLRDPDGLAFTVGFVDGVVRPEDLRVAARTLREIAPNVPAFCARSASSSTIGEYAFCGSSQSGSSGW